MRRLAITALTALAAAGLAGGALGSPEIAKSKAYVRIKSCSLDDHSAVFYGRMRKVAGTRRMSMRFALLERVAGSRRFKRVHAPGLTHWRKSAEGVRSYGYSQEVRGLEDGAAYRMKVRYRWWGAAHKLLKSAHRRSRTCRMFVPLANLSVRLLDAGPSGDVWRYRVRVANRGQATADDTAVQLAVDGGVVDTETISHLEPGETQRKDFNGPACVHLWSAVADPANAISETNEADNRAAALCLPTG
jgi:hypothetical protein